MSIAASSTAAVLILAGASSAAVIEIYQLYDHPDGVVNPPPYGVRFDDIFASISGPGGVTTFSMDTIGDSTLTVIDDGGGDYRIQVAGTLYGGVDTGSGYGFGEGLYDLFFEYQANVAPSGTGWVVNPSSALNTGTLTSQGNADVAAGTVFDFFDKGLQSTGDSFLFLQDDHRLDGHPQDGQGYWVGRGWFDADWWSPGPNSLADFLFYGELIPTPSAMSLLGVAGLVAMRRRR